MGGDGGAAPGGGSNCDGRGGEGGGEDEAALRSGWRGKNCCNDLYTMSVQMQTTIVQGKLLNYLVCMLLCLVTAKGQIAVQS